MNGGTVMYILHEEKVMGYIKIRLQEYGYRNIDRKRILEVLKETAEKETNEVRKEDYKILCSAIMGIEVFILEKNLIQVVYTPEAKMRGEGEAIIRDNDRLLQILEEIWHKLPFKKRGDAL